MHQKVGHFEGQLLPISQHAALFSILGTMYCGNGTTTFALPDLRGSVPIGAGQGPGLSLRVQGETGGSETVTLLESEMPNHSHLGNIDLTVSAKGSGTLKSSSGKP